jgi:hypothetical protein
MQQNYTYRIQ